MPPDAASQIAALTRALAEAQAEAAAQRRLAEQQQRQVAQLLDQVAQLTAMLRRFLRESPRFELPDPPDDDPEPPPAVGGQGTTGGTSGSRSRKKAPGKGGRRGPSASLETETVTMPAPERCAHCPDGGRLLARDVEVSSKYTAVTGFVRRREIRRAVCVCAVCNRRTTAEMPPLPWDGSQFTPEFVAWVVYMKFVLMVPLDRLHKALRRQGVDLPWSSVVYIIEKATEILGPVDGEHWKQLIAGDAMGVDGTGLSVVVPGLHQVWKGVLDVFCRDHLHVFQYSATKHADTLADKLGGFAGTVVCDGEFRNDAALGAAAEANCNAHPRRKFLDAQKLQPELAKAGKSFIDRMYAVEDEARKLGLTGEALLAIRQARTRPIAEELRRWLVEVEPDLTPSDKLGKVVRYCIKHFEPLTRFIDDANLPIDNNRSERAFQMHARLRDNAMFAGSPEGAHRWACLLGICTTAKRLGVDILAYLTWAFERLGTHRKRFGLAARDLTPEAYKASREVELAEIAAK